MPAFNSFIDTFFRTTTAELSEVEPRIRSVSPEAWATLPPGYASAMLDQYKIYVEMADRISARRSLANTFFLTLNSAIFTVFGVLWQHLPAGKVWWLVFPLIALVGQCLAWYCLLRSYRQLNSAKYTVIGAMETHLPASPYWAAEWSALGEGRIRSRYLPLTHVEQWIPLLFAVTYLAAFAAALLS